MTGERGTKAFWGTVVDIFISPVDGFKNVAVKGMLWQVIVLQIVAVWISRLDARAFAKAQLEATEMWDDLSDTQKAKMLDFQAAAMKPTAWVASVAGPALIVIVVGSWMFGSLRVLFGCDLGYGRSLAAAGFALLPSVFLSDTLTLATMVVKGEWNISPGDAFKTSLAMLLDQASTSKALYAFADSIDAITFWGLALLVVGFSRLAGRGYSTVVWPALVGWGVVTFVRVGSALFM